MKKIVVSCLFLGISAAVLALYVWPYFYQIKHYTQEELIGLTCDELGERHEEVIFAYHDAAIRHFNRTGAFPDDLGLPQANDLPYVILMEKFIQDNDLEGFNLSKPHALSTSGPEYEFFAEITRICAASPSLDAGQAFGQAAQNLNLTN
ncbi:hypothetical protein [uncultured Sulfitobacter sp.]|mgnify:CR=1 FL=1|uniref:hypothetical protein n=1 Tax=uncultured Sulfitobacter sp. TaxID=191468 RepID=UPI0030D8E2A9|tara:strand:- start:116664 stop:117110 length:447 start_codon:yes stop_codon:yes gene_type:complete